jgi:hypothetical protein
VWAATTSRIRRATGDNYLGTDQEGAGDRGRRLPGTATSGQSRHGPVAVTSGQRRHGPPAATSGRSRQGPAAEKRLWTSKQGRTTIRRKSVAARSRRSKKFVAESISNKQGTCSRDRAGESSGHHLATLDSSTGYCPSLLTTKSPSL